MAPLRIFRSATNVGDGVAATFGITKWAQSAIFQLALSRRPYQHAAMRPTPAILQSVMPRRPSQPPSVRPTLAISQFILSWRSCWHLAKRPTLAIYQSALPWRSCGLTATRRILAIYQSVPVLAILPASVEATNAGDHEVGAKRHLSICTDAATDRPTPTIAERSMAYLANKMVRVQLDAAVGGGFP